MKEDLKLRGIITLRKIKDGKVIEEETVNNTITNVGKADVAGLICDTGSIVAYQWLAIGDSSTAATSADTTLVGEFVSGTDPSLARVRASITRMTTSETNDTFQLLHTFTNTASAAKTVVEAGIFNTSTEDTANALGRQTFGGKSLETGTELQVQYRVRIA